MAFTSLLGFVRAGFNAYFGAYDAWMQARPGFMSVLSILDSREVEGFRDAPRGLRPQGALQLNQVHFHYPGDEQPVALDNLNLDIPRGQRIGLVGETGAGKSTFLDLLMGFYTPSSGEILYDGNRLEDIGLLNLRRSVAIMGQDAFLWNTTVRENIRYGCPTASDAEVEEAARHAQAHDFVLRLDQGYSTLRNVERVLVFQQGRIIEDGSIPELLANPQGHYARLHALQAG